MSVARKALVTRIDADVGTWQKSNPGQPVPIGLVTTSASGLDPDIAPADLGPDWLGGFFCPCHQSKYDLAGRVYKGMPAPTNLVIPPYKFLSDTRVVIGEDDTKKA